MPNRELEAVILCPTGQDSHLISSFLNSESIRTVVIKNIKEFVDHIQSYSGAFIIADEAITGDELELLNNYLSLQEPWSDLPIILLVSGGPRKRPSVKGMDLFIASGSVSLLERPLQPLSLLSTINVAFRSRRRQFEVRDLLVSTAEATKMRDEFISIASHELKTPLTSLKLQTQMSHRKLQKDQFPKEKLLYQFDSTIKQIDRLNKLVDDMLDITRINTGRLTLAKSDFNFSELLQEMIERFIPQFEAANITLNASISPGIEGTWDSYKLEQVINNLFSNAIRYAPDGPLTVTLEKEKHKLRLTVSDTGPGIKEENLTKIFERFERDNHNRGGLGLGLYITKQIIELHKGSIRAECPGTGTTFTLELPL